MSLITRCPACGTMFKVVPDQLRISEGWVRCGNCSEVFDAAATLHGQADDVPQETAPAPMAASEEPPADFVPTVPPAQVSSPALLLKRPTPEPAPSAGPVADAPDSIAAPPLYPWFPSEVRDSQTERMREEDEEPDLDDVSFVRHARRKAFWSRPGMRMFLLFAAVGLSLLLALQYVAHDRDRLAAARPELGPLIERLCVPLQCRVGPPRQIDAVVIDSSTFSKLRNDGYRLSFTLKNLAPIDLATPSLELTLTDTQDQPVIRRVLDPRDLRAAAVIPAASDWTGSLAMAVTGNAGGGRIAGYRLLAFYP